MIERTTMRRSLWAIAALASGAALLGAAGSGPDLTAEHPAEATSADSQEMFGESVRLPEGGDSFHSGRLKPGEAFSHIFEAAGTYQYFCVPHEGAKMRGTIIVQKREEGLS